MPETQSPPLARAEKPLGSVLLAADGTAHDFRSRVRHFFGATVDDDGYIHDAEDVAGADREWPAQAPHKQAFVYTN